MINYLMGKNFYITTPIYYPSAKPHMGHAYSSIIADFFARFKKIDGYKIHKDDIAFLLKEAKKQLTLNDKKQSIIHIFNYNYIVDGKTFVEEPIDVLA